MLWAWQVLGWLLTVLCAVAILIAIVPLRRKSPRCPKCRYDFSGTHKAAPAGPWTCPECGKVTTRERALFRVRRRRRLALALPLAALLFASGFVARRAPEIAEYGWWAAVPRPLLLVGFWIGLDYEPRLGRLQSKPPSRDQLWSDVLEWRYIEAPVGWWPGEASLAIHTLNHVSNSPQPSSMSLELLAGIVGRSSSSPPEWLNHREQARILWARSLPAAERKGTWRVDAALTGSDSRDHPPFILPVAMYGSSDYAGWRVEIDFRSGDGPIIMGDDRRGRFGEYNDSNRQIVWAFMDAQPRMGFRTVGGLIGPAHAFIHDEARVSRVRFDGRRAYLIRSGDYHVIMDAQNGDILRLCGQMKFGRPLPRGLDTITLRHDPEPTDLAATGDFRTLIPRGLSRAESVAPKLAELEPIDGW